MSSKKKIVLTAVITAAVTAFISCAATSFVKDNIMIYFRSDDEDKAFSNKFGMVEMMLDKRYLYDYDKTKAREEALASYVDALGEPYTKYYNPEEFSSYMTNIQDGYVGIGVIVGVNEENRIEVIAPYEGSPAFEAGVQPGDILTAIDGAEYGGDRLNEAVNSIKSGKEGTTVNITILRNGSETITLDVERRDIASDSVKAQMIDSDIGYIRITGFNMESENGEHSTFSEFKDKFAELESAGMKKLIIDLRDNPGGILNEACSIADMLLPEGTITYTENKEGEKQYYSSDAESKDIPMAVLINGNSASASEVLTGALKDYGKAVVIGEKSYGKGIVQDVYPFYDGSGISLTSSKYYTPNGVCIHEIGIEPDISVTMPEEYKGMFASMIERDKDVQLQKAIEVIGEK